MVKGQWRQESSQNFVGKIFFKIMPSFMAKDINGINPREYT